MQPSTIYDPAVTFPETSATPYDPTQRQKTWEVIASGEPSTEARILVGIEEDLAHDNLPPV